MAFIGKTSNKKEKHILKITWLCQKRYFSNNISCQGRFLASTHRNAEIKCSCRYTPESFFGECGRIDDRFQQRRNKKII